MAYSVKKQWILRAMTSHKKIFNQIHQNVVYVKKQVLLILVLTLFGEYAKIV